MNFPISRRRFLASNLQAALAASAFPAVIPISALGRGRKLGANDRVNVGCIGVGPQGRGVMAGFLSLDGARVVAVCDVATPHRAEAARQVNARYGDGACATLHDYRELLARPDVDVVSIATPDHWHVPIAIAAAKAGKDIYLEKPMGLTVAEDQALRKAVTRNKRVFQFGTQQRSSREFLRAVEWVRSGRIGELRRIHVWSPASRPGGSIAPTAVPEGWDFGTWLGPAPEAPCTDGLLIDNAATGAWKTWWYRYDYALGFIAGWGVHPLDVALWGYPAMMNGPMEVEGRGVFPESGECNTSIAWDVEYRFASGVTMRFRGTPNVWDGTSPWNDFKEWTERYDGIEGHGTAFEGTEGWICVHRGAVRTHPARLAEEPLGKEDPGVLRSSHHQRNLIEAARSRGPTVCAIGDAVQADVLCHLGDIATRVGRKLTWDPRRERFEKDADANRRLELRAMRKPWDRLV